MDKTPTNPASTSSSQHASLSSDPAALRSTPGSSSRARTLLADPVMRPTPTPIPAPASISVAPTPARDNSAIVSTTRADTPAALGDDTASQDASPHTPVVSATTVIPESSTGPPTSGQTPVTATKKAPRPRRVGPKTVPASENSQASAPARQTRKTGTKSTTKTAAPKETTTKTTKKAKTSKKDCPGRYVTSLVLFVLHLSLHTL